MGMSRPGTAWEASPLGSPSVHNASPETAAGGGLALLRTGRTGLDLNLEQHQFGTCCCCGPDVVHVYAFGAGGFRSPGESVARRGDVLEIGAQDFGRPIHNPFAAATQELPVAAKAL
jgi:hypothetical protein